MRQIVIDGSQVKRRKDLKEQLNIEANFEDWFDDNAEAYIEKISGHKQLDHFKEANDVSEQLVIVIENSEELFLKASVTFKWFVNKVMRFNRRYRRKLDIDEALIALKLV